jgi:hypothetical protein
MTQSFSVVELADTVTVRKALDGPDKRSEYSSCGLPGSRRRSRSPVRVGRWSGNNSWSWKDGDRGPLGIRRRSRSPRRVGRWSGNNSWSWKDWDNSCSLEGWKDRRYVDGVRDFQRRCRDWPLQVKPDLWGAVERGDEAAVVRLVRKEGKDIEEKFDGWSPLMKAAEEDYVGILKVLWECNADLEVTNKNGRSALSFAASPSWERPTSLAALRFLLQAGADIWRRDIFGQTALERCRREKRTEAILILEEFEGMSSVGSALVSVGKVGYM